MNNQSKCRTLFTSMLTISAFTFGGGAVIIPMMRKKMVEDLGWLSEEDLLDIIAIAQSSPGAVSVNVAAQIGHRIAGMPACSARRWRPSCRRFAGWLSSPCSTIPSAPLRSWIL